MTYQNEFVDALSAFCATDTPCPATIEELRDKIVARPDGRNMRQFLWLLAERLDAEAEADNG